MEQNRKDEPPLPEETPRRTPLPRGMNADAGWKGW